MKSQTSLIASQCRLQQWAKQIQDCQNRPVDMQVAEWCEMNGNRQFDKSRVCVLIFLDVGFPDATQTIIVV